MDARITKQRLANMLSYDWLKIVGVLVAAVVFFAVFFTMIGTRATVGQKFYVYAYNSLKTGGEFSQLDDTLMSRKVFGYDILDTSSESFRTSRIYGNSVFLARRAAGEGRVMFVDDIRTEDEEGNVSSTLLSFIEGAGTEKESFSSFLDPEVFLNDCKTYLETFFGAALSGEPNQDKAREAFMARNGKDKRFRTAEKKEAGVLDEIKRLRKLRDDYLFVSEAMGKSLSYITYTSEIKTHTIAFSMTSLNLTSLVYYTAETEEGEAQTNRDVALCIFNNNNKEGDLKYETVNFLAYLVEKYGDSEAQTGV